MKKMSKLLSLLLAIVTLISALSSVVVISASAAETTTVERPAIEKYTSTKYNTPSEKLATMEKLYAKYGYELYVDDQSGEIAVVESASGNTLFSNPYDVASSTGSAATKQEILSQIMIQYTDNGTTKKLWSFTEAALRNQIKVMKIKNGVRVEYVIGREETRKLVPYQILDDSWQEFINGPLTQAMNDKVITKTQYNRFVTWWGEYSIDDTSLAKKTIESYKILYPILNEVDRIDEKTGKEVHKKLWILDTSVTSVKLNELEDIIKQYCEDYSFEQMDADYEAAGYEPEDMQYPLFKLALEYSFDESGLVVRMPCNGLRYDMATYTLEYISVLPYMGAGNSKNAGYNFYPDGSGSLFDFEQLNTKQLTNVRGKIYGVDYAYQTISGATYQKVIRYPVYGTVATEKIYNYAYNDSTGKAVTAAVSNTVKTADTIKSELAKAGAVLTSGDLEKTAVTYTRGFLCIVEEGESLGEIATYHAGSTSDYNTMMNYFNPKPKDSYDLADSISVTSSSTWTVVSDRKYTGSITLRYLMLCDSENEKVAQTVDANYHGYETTWMGMAEAYRDYLESIGTLTRLTNADVQTDYIPLYLETFGAIEVTKSIATIPVDVMTPLTTFENVYTMYSELAEQGVKNVNFRLTGYANGGMYATVPSSLKWESAVGGKSGFKKLLEKAAEINAKGDGSHLGLFPDFDFAYIQKQETFDGVNLKKDAIKTIDNRYTSLRLYSATSQDYVSFYQLALSPARYSKFSTKFLKNYAKYDINTISLASLGTTLNSDFDEDAPYNREDDKDFTAQTLNAFKEAGYTVMSDDANAYVLPYTQYLLNVSLDSSRYVKSAASVPFVGVLLHGYVQFAGGPLNEEGDTDYAILRAIENGAGMYFILSYQNQTYLKEDTYLSQNYSVRYDIWKEDVAKYYNQLNDVLADVQTKLIVNHEFLVGERLLDDDELIDEVERQLEEAAKAEAEAQAAEATAKALTVANAWLNAFNAEDDVTAMIAEMQSLNANITTLLDSFTPTRINPLNSAVEVNPNWIIYQLRNMSSNYKLSLEDEELTAAEKKAAKTNFVNSLNTLRSNFKDIIQAYEDLCNLSKAIVNRIESFDEYRAIINGTTSLTDEVKAQMIAKINGYETLVTAYKTQAETLVAENAAYFDATTSGQTDTKFIGDQIETLFSDPVWNIKNFLTAETVAGMVFPNATEDPEKTFYEILKSDFFSYKEIVNAVKTVESSEEGDEEETTVNRYLVDNKKIVAVSYGDRDSTTFEKTVYKTILLNYNAFDVRVVYGELTYTIPGGGYVVIAGN